MRVPLSWLRQYADLPPDVTGAAVGDALLQAGLEVEKVESVGAGVGGVVVGEVLDYADEPQSNGKTIRWCHVDVGEPGPRGIVCGAQNFAVGDRVPVALPGAVLAGDFRISARKTYGHVSDGMICSARELGIGEDHTGILVLAERPEIGADAVALLELRDDVLDIAIKPDRSYCLSVRGLAREAATSFGVKFSDPASLAVPAAGGGYPVRIDDVTGCDRYLARVVTGIDRAAASPRWMQRLLVLAGMRPISLVVDVTNYVMLATGQPLHAFDRARLSGPIVVRRASAGERLTTLDGVARALDPDDLVIADDSGAIALAGVMGGGPTECTEGTRDVLIEAAHFAPVAVARTARRHRLPSEASRRFERGVDDALAPHAAELAVQLLRELAGDGVGELDEVTDTDLRPPAPTITLPLDLPGRLAGRPYDPDVVRRRLADVGCSVTGDGPLAVVPPSWRPDLRQPADLVEEVVRLEGYDTIPAALPVAPAGRGLTRPQRLRRQAGRVLAGRGFVEVTSYPFVGESPLGALLLPADDPRLRLVRLANPLSDDEPFLRTTLLPGLATTLKRNVGRGFADVAVFEMGIVFRAREPQGDRLAVWPGVEGRPSDGELAGLDAALPAQPRHVGVLAAGRIEPAGWWGAGREVTWADAIEAARAVAEVTGAVLEVVAPGEGTGPLHPGRAAALWAGGQQVGYAGELHPRVVAALELPARTVAMELDFDALVALDRGLDQAPSISPFPPTLRDVALVVASDVPAAEVETALRSGAGPLLESIRLFDVYTGAQVPEGHRSLAYALRFRAPDRTLTDEEANAARDAAVEAAIARTGGRLRA